MPAPSATAQPQPKTTNASPAPAAAPAADPFNDGFAELMTRKKTTPAAKARQTGV